MSIRRRLLMTLLALGVLSACQPQPDVTPSAAFIHVSAAEPAGSDIRLELVGSDNESVSILDANPGERIIGQHASLPGLYTLRVHSADCSIEVDLESGLETDITMDQGAPENCLAVAGSHVAGEAPHPFFGALSLTVTGVGARSSVVELVSLDLPPNPVGRVLTADETGEYFVPDLPQGRYEVRVHDGATSVATESFTVGAGPAASVDLDILLPSSE